MSKKTVKYGLAACAALVMSMVHVQAESPRLAMGEPVLLKGSAKVQVGKPAPKLAAIEAGRSLVIDGEVRTLGGSQAQTEGHPRQFPAQKFPFILDAQALKGNPQLTIGYIRGLNTPEAHAAGQSETKFVSSPAVIKVNGVRIQYVYTAGDLLKIQIPKSALKPDGFNVVQIEAGFYFLPGNQVAYDQIELQHIALSY